MQFIFYILLKGVKGNTCELHVNIYGFSQMCIIIIMNKVGNIDKYFLTF